MRDYARVSPAFWTKGSGKALRGDRDAQLVALYVVTCPSANMIGLYYLPITLLAHEVGISIEGARKALRRVETAGFAYYDEVSELVWVPNAAAYQIGDELIGADKRRAAVLRELTSVGKHRFVRDFFDKYGAPYGLARLAWIEELETLTQGASEGLRSQDQDHAQEQAQEQDQKKVGVSEGGVSDSGATLSLLPDEQARGRKRARKSPEVRAVFDAWAAERKRRHPRGPMPALDDKRAEIIQARLLEGFDVATLTLAVRGIWRSAWHLGQNDRGTEYTDIRHAIGEAAKVERFAELAGETDAARQSRTQPVAEAAPANDPEPHTEAG